MDIKKRYGLLLTLFLSFGLDELRLPSLLDAVALSVFSRFDFDFDLLRSLRSRDDEPRVSAAVNGDLSSMPTIS